MVNYCYLLKSGSLWMYGLFWDEDNLSPKDSEGAFRLPLIAWNNLNTVPVPARELSLEITTKGKLEGSQQRLFKFLSVSCFLCMAWQIFVYQTFDLPIFLWIIFLSFEVSNTYPLLLRSEWHISLNWPVFVLLT